MKSLGKVIRSVGWVTLAISFILASSAWPKSPEKVLIHADFGHMVTLDPAFVIIIQDLMMSRAINQSLLRYKFSSAEIEGDLAESWSISKDGLSYTFNLRKDVNWHKGFGKFTARDVKYTFDRFLDPKTGAPARAQIVDDIKEVQLLDDYTIRFQLNHPCAPFLHKLVGPRGVGIVNQKAVEKFGKEFARNPIGTGPYIFESWTREQAVMVANKEFRQREGPPKIEKVIYKPVPDVDTALMALQKGEIDMVWLVPRDQAVVNRLEAAGCKVTRVKRGGALWLMMNNKKKPFEDIRVRRAVAHAIDKDILVKHVVGGMGERMDSLVPKGYFGHTEKGFPSYDYNPEKAKNLLAQAGYPDGFSVTLDTDTSPSRLPVATAITEQLRQVNISVKLDVTDQTAWLKKRSMGTGDFIISTSSLQPDADFHLMRHYHSSSFPPGLNFSRYDKIDDPIDKARAERNENKRLEYYSQLQKKLMEDLPDIPLLMQDYPAAYRNYISGVSEREFVWGFDVYHFSMGEKK